MPEKRDVTNAEVDAAWRRVMDPVRQRPVRRRYELAALDVVKGLKRDYLPDMDDNDGGQILSWLLDLVCVAVLTELDLEKSADWRELHMQINVAYRRAGVRMFPSACDGPDCEVCRQLSELVRVPAQRPEQET